MQAAQACVTGSVDWADLAAFAGGLKDEDRTEFQTLWPWLVQEIRTADEDGIAFLTELVERGARHVAAALALEQVATTRED